MTTEQEVAALLARQNKAAAFRGLVRGLCAVATILMWELFSAFAFPVISGHQLRVAQHDRDQIRESVNGIYAELNAQSRARDDAVRLLLSSCRQE